MVDNLAYRQAIVDLAKKFAGCHYLWGAAGARPGFLDGADYRPGSVTLARPSLHLSAPCLNAAQCSASGSTYVCAGRWKKTVGGKITRAGDPDLVDFLSMFRAEGWHVYTLGYADPKREYFLRLTPRVVVGDNISQQDGGGQIVWGQDCRGIRHFDCIGFVNYVLDETTSAPYGTVKEKIGNKLVDVKVEGWSDDIGGWVKATQPIPVDEAPVPGDLLFRKNDKGGWGHIAFLSAEVRQGRVTGTVIQAEDAAHGVHAEDAYYPGSWHARGRLSDYFFQTRGVRVGPVTQT